MQNKPSLFYCRAFLIAEFLIKKSKDLVCSKETYPLFIMQPTLLKYSSLLRLFYIMNRAQFLQLWNCNNKSLSENVLKVFLLLHTLFLFVIWLLQGAMILYIFLQHEFAACIKKRHPARICSIICLRKIWSSWTLWNWEWCSM